MVKSSHKHIIQSANSTLLVAVSSSLVPGQGHNTRMNMLILSHIHQRGFNQRAEKKTFVKERLLQVSLPECIYLAGRKPAMG